MSGPVPSSASFFALLAPWGALGSRGTGFPTLTAGPRLALRKIAGWGQEIGHVRHTHTSWMPLTFSKYQARKLIRSVLASHSQLRVGVLDSISGVVTAISSIFTYFISTFSLFSFPFCLLPNEYWAAGIKSRVCSTSKRD